MKITRKDFKELIDMHEKLWEVFNELCDYYDEDVIGTALFKGICWIEEKLGIRKDDFDLLQELWDWGYVGINWREVKEGHWICDPLEDLDKIYDYFLAPKDGKEEFMIGFKELDEFHKLEEEIVAEFNSLSEYYNPEKIHNILDATCWIAMKWDEQISGYEDFAAI